MTPVNPAAAGAMRGREMIIDRGARGGGQRRSRCAGGLLQPAGDRVAPLGARRDEERRLPLGDLPVQRVRVRVAGLHEQAPQVPLGDELVVVAVMPARGSPLHIGEEWSDRRVLVPDGRRAARRARRRWRPAGSIG